MPAIGVTGNIAAGKSEFCRFLLARVEADFFDADACARRLLDADPGVRANVTADLHRDAYRPDGKPDRKLIRELIFRDSDMKTRLEAILHPLVRQQWQRALDAAAERGRWFVADIPLLFEIKAEAPFARVITVACSRETQIRRLAARNGFNREISEKIIASQLPIGVKIASSHHVIWNDASLEALTAQTDLLARLLHDRFG